MLVSKQWRQVLQANASVWRGARYHKTPELSIPPPPPGFPEWRYGTWIYGSRICTVRLLRLILRYACPDLLPGSVSISFAEAARIIYHGLQLID